MKTFSYSFRLAHLLNLSKRPSYLLDRFFLGGPLSVRGFKLNSIGPKEGKESLGGNFYLESGISMSFPFTQDSKKYLVNQIFVNGGNLIDLSSSSNIRFYLKI